MSKVFINEETLVNIGSAIREKTGKTNLIAPGDMPNEIRSITTGNGGGAAAVIEELTITNNGTYTAPDGVDGYNPINVNVPQEGGPPTSAFVFTDACDYVFGAGQGIWDWFIQLYGNQITTNKLTSCRGMFQNTQVSEIPFTIDFGDTLYLNNMFDNASNLAKLPKFNIPNNPYWNTITWSSGDTMFRQCNDILNIDTALLKTLHSKNNLFFNQMFYSCNSLEELIGISAGPADYAITSNKFSLTFGYCYRIKDVIFDTDNGAPYIRQWKSQTIDMSMSTGWGMPKINANLSPLNGLSSEGYVSDDASYQAKKNNSDWYTDKVAYSRYNHDSAVNTINSLPDTSAYLASAGGTNTIKFKGEAGSATDGGAINMLTEEEIAIATAKGWTVSLV